ncbi:MAG: cation-efflux pump [Armatimonadetes bacterium]|nr:cation-efflux pump [Armatimonadota bacterium]
MTAPSLPESASREKNAVALTSVAAALLLTGTKLVVGWETGSLGILSEAAHSGLDLVAALLTMFAVRYADRPADEGHPYGHGKAENLSALFETLLLLVTCGWIAWEATQRLLFRHVPVEASPWAFGVVLLSIVVDVSRSRALLRVAKKHRSQALEADALHFSTDVWSSCVVLVGLTLVKVGDWTGNHELFAKADALAALVVAGIVVFVSARMGKRAVDVLLDRSPLESLGSLRDAIAGVAGVEDVSWVRARESGQTMFVETSVRVGRNLPLEAGYGISREIEDAVRNVLPRSDVVVRLEPTRTGDEDLRERVAATAWAMGLQVHNVAVFEEQGRPSVEMHLEVDGETTLREAHEAADRLEAALHQDLPELGGVFVHIENDRGPAKTAQPGDRPKIVAFAREACHEHSGVRCTEVSVHETGWGVFVRLWCVFPAEMKVGEVHWTASRIEERIREAFPCVAQVSTHAEPDE